ncbi:MAG: ClpXP protease specificity-enhancing factor SspB [Pseudomonadota bacterium]
MPVDHIRYDILAQDALRGLVRRVLTDAGKKGLPGDHHFFITFNTQHDAVRLSPRLREQYPEEMTIVLQHQFWDLKITDEAFEVGLSFSGVAERLYIPFEAITAFADPSVQFALQFETLVDAPEEGVEAPPPLRAVEKPADKSKNKTEPARSAPAAAKPAAASASSKDDDTDGPPDKPSGEVVRLDRFRKK